MGKPFYSRGYKKEFMTYLFGIKSNKINLKDPDKLICHDLAYFSYNLIRIPFFHPVIDYPFWNFIKIICTKIIEE